MPSLVLPASNVPIPDTLALEMRLGEKYSLFLLPSKDEVSAGITHPRQSPTRLRGAWSIEWQFHIRSAR